MCFKKTLHSFEEGFGHFSLKTLLDCQFIFGEPFVCNVLKVRINSILECFLNFFYFFYKSLFILSFKSFFDFSNLSSQSSFKDSLCFCFKLFGEFFTTKKCINIFFDVILFCLFFYNFFSLFNFSKNFFIIKFLFFLNCLHSISSFSTFVDNISHLRKGLARCLQLS